MSSVKQEPSPGQKSAVPAMKWSDPHQVYSLLYGIRILVSDAQGAAEDQLLPKRERRLGHLEAERILRESFKKLDDTLTFAERDLPAYKDNPLLKVG